MVAFTPYAVATAALVGLRAASAFRPPSSLTTPVRSFGVSRSLPQSRGRPHMSAASRKLERVHVWVRDASGGGCFSIGLYFQLFQVVIAVGISASACTE